MTPERRHPDRRAPDDHRMSAGIALTWVAALGLSAVGVWTALAWLVRLLR